MAIVLEIVLMNANDPSKKTIEMPAATPWPLVLSVGVAAAGIGFATSLGFLVVGLMIFTVGLGGWIGQLVSTSGHVQEPVGDLIHRPDPIVPRPNTVTALRPGGVGYRFRLPEHVHPLTSGIKGGLVGGMVMPFPALIFGLAEYGSPWLPVNLLAGMAIPGLADASLESLTQFHLGSLIFGSIVHLAFSITFGLMYGVILPMLPSFRGSSLFFGGVLMPIFWSSICYGLVGIVNPLLERHVDWRWFVLSQFVFGLAMSFVVFRSEKVAVAQTPPLRGGSKVAP